MKKAEIFINLALESFESGILKKIISLGARLATNGEFTKRAFMNGKLSLSSAEGLIDMINSESESGVKAGYYLYREKLTAQICALQDVITDALAEIDADMDFPEEDLEFDSTETVKRNVTEVIEKIQGLLSSYHTGRTLKNGVSVGIVGKPNTGKSSLLNALLNYDKAIVSDIALSLSNMLIPLFLSLKTCLRVICIASEIACAECPLR